MLLGEHAVLHGQHALVCALDKRITVTLTPRDDQQVIITSQHGQFATQLSHITLTKPFQFVLGALQHYRAYLKTGCDVVIESGFSDQIGFGSSAAVTVAMVAVIRSWLSRSVAQTTLLREARTVVRSVQGLGSGADVAASVYGGVVAYRAQPLQVENFSHVHPITVIYSGYKTPTVDVVKRVQQAFISHPELLQQIYISIGACTTRAIQLLREQNLAACGEMMNIQQGMMEALGVSTPFLNAIITTLRQQPGMSGAKISGSGLGDCIIGWGADTAPAFTERHVRVIPTTISTLGVLVRGR